MINLVQDFLTKDPGTLQIGILAAFDILFLAYVGKNIRVLFLEAKKAEASPPAEAAPLETATEAEPLVVQSEVLQESTVLVEAVHQETVPVELEESAAATKIDLGIPVDTEEPVAATRIDVSVPVETEEPVAATKIDITVPVESEEPAAATRIDISIPDVQTSLVESLPEENVAVLEVEKVTSRTAEAESPSSEQNGSKNKKGSLDNISPRQAKVIIAVVAIVITLVTWKLNTTTKVNPLLMKSGDEVLTINGVAANDSVKIDEMKNAMMAPDSKVKPVLVYKMKRPDGSTYDKEIPLPSLGLPPQPAPVAK